MTASKFDTEIDFPPDIHPAFKKNSTIDVLFASKPVITREINRKNLENRKIVCQTLRHKSINALILLAFLNAWELQMRSNVL